MSGIMSFEDEHQLVLERKQRKRLEAETRRQEGLRLIHERMLDKGRGENALEILEQEMWEHILDYIQCPFDLQSWSETCTLFQRLLVTRRVRDILLPMVVRTIPAVTQNYDLKTLFTLRLVSRSCRAASDFLLSTKVTNEWAWPRLQIKIPFYGILPRIPRSQLWGELNRLLRLYPADSRIFPSFLTQHVKVQLIISKQSDWTNSTSGLAKITQLIENIGRHVKSAKFQLPDSPDVPIPEVYETLFLWVSLMPNLLSLEVKVASDLYTKCHRPKWHLPQLTRAIQDKPFPHLKDLQQLNVKNMDVCSRSDDAFNLIASTIIQQNQHISSLYVDYSTCVRRCQPPISPIMKLSLREINVDAVGGDVLQLKVNSEWFFSPDWELQTIRIHAPDLFDKDAFDIVRRFPSLSEISLKVDHLSGGQGQPEPLRELTNVARLELNYANNVTEVMTIDFLLPLEKLKIFACEVSPSSRGKKRIKAHESNEMVLFSGDKASFTRHNIWDLFPSLKTIFLKRDRHYWKKRMGLYKWTGAVTRDAVMRIRESEEKLVGSVGDVCVNDTKFSRFNI